MDDTPTPPKKLSERMKRYVDSIDLEIEVRALESRLAEAEAKANSLRECERVMRETAVANGERAEAAEAEVSRLARMLNASNPAKASEMASADGSLAVQLAAAQAREAGLRSALGRVGIDLAYLNSHGDDCPRRDVCDSQPTHGCDDPECARASGGVGNCCEEHEHEECPECECLLAVRDAVRVALSDAPPAAEPTPDPSDDDAILALVQDLAKAGLRYELNPTQYLGPDADRSRAWWQERFGQADQDIRSRAREALRACGWKIDVPPAAAPALELRKALAIADAWFSANQHEGGGPNCDCAQCEVGMLVRRAISGAPTAETNSPEIPDGSPRSPFAWERTDAPESCAECDREGVPPERRQLRHAEVERDYYRSIVKDYRKGKLSCPICAARASEDGLTRYAPAITEQLIDAKRAATAMHLPAQMEELRELLLDFERAAKTQPNAHWMLYRISQCLRLVPVQHDDQQGGRPVATVTMEQTIAFPEPVPGSTHHEGINHFSRCGLNDGEIAADAAKVTCPRCLAMLRFCEAIAQQPGGGR